MKYDPKEITTRFLKVAAELEYSDAELARTLELSRQNIRQMRKGDTALVLKRAVPFLAKHREINTDWLLFEDGEMFTREGKHHFSIDSNGDAHFYSDFSKEQSPETGNLKELLAEKEKHNESLKEALKSQNEVIKNLNDYIKALLK